MCSFGLVGVINCFMLLSMFANRERERERERERAENTERSKIIASLIHADV